MNLIDTHCHIHEADYPLDRAETLTAAQAAGVTKIICVGTDMQSSRDAVEFVEKYSCHPDPGLDPGEGSPAKLKKDSSVTLGMTNTPQIFAILGVHPHEARRGIDGLAELLKQKRKVVGVGEIGLDYFYDHSPRATQIEILQSQIELALKHHLPISFHVRDDRAGSGAVWRDFWSIFDNFRGVRGVLHSFTDTPKNLEQGLERGLFVGVNGIATFNKNPTQTTVYQTIPLDRLLLETDAPFLAPVPFRGRPNQPAFIPKIVEFLAGLRGEGYEQIAVQTTKNAEKLFHI